MSSRDAVILNNMMENHGTGSSSSLRQGLEVKPPFSIITERSAGEKKDGRTATAI